MSKFEERIGNRKVLYAYRHTQIGKKYYLPVPWLAVGTKARQHVQPPRMMLKCTGKSPNHAQFETPSGIVVCFSYFDLEREYRKEESLV